MTYRYLALGDSYTIGESLPPAQSWPEQLVQGLRAEGLAIEAPCITAQTGWTTCDLLEAVERRGIQGPFDLVTLLIGVNNQYQGHDSSAYRDQFGMLLEMAIQFTRGDPGSVLVLSIPDWGMTPFAEGRDRSRIQKEIAQFNLINREISQVEGVYYVDIAPISRRVCDDPKLLASDGLHFSGEMYAAWVDLIVPVVRRILLSKEK